MRAVPVAVRRSAVLATFSLTLLALALVGCGTNSKTTTTTTTTPTTPAPPAPPAQPSYPSTPPVPITWSPSTSLLPAPPACDPPTSACTPPDPNGSNDFPLTVASPINGATTTSPMSVVATANPKNPLFFMRVYVDQVAMYFTFTNSINTQLFIAPGQHTVEVMAEDTSGYISSTIVSVTVTTQAQTTISGIQNMPGWQTCAADFPAGSGRDGQLCASGNPNPPTFSITQGQATPAMDGKSAEFSISGPNAYSNQLSFNAIAGGNNVSHFIYDLYFYIDNPSAPQALEFDVNQGFGGNRWVWGSECNFKGETPPMWDIWDDASGVWRETNVPCTPFPANTWVHLIWTIERVGNQVHYISLQVGSQVYNIDTYYNNQTGWTLEEIDTAFQMDMAEPAVPYNVWLDEVNLTAY